MTETTQETPPIDPAAAPMLAKLKELSAGLLARELVTAGDADADGFDPVDVALATIDARTVELAQLNKAISTQQGQVTRAKNALAKAKAEISDAPGKARAVAPLKGAALRPLELLELIDAAETAEIVGSDGKSEIKGIESLTLSGGDLATQFRPLGGGLGLRLASFEVHGPSDGKKRGLASLEGWGLFLDGSLVAYRRRANGTLPLGAGQTYNLAGDVLF